MMGQHLVMCEEKCLPAVVVRRIVKLIAVLVPCSLVFVCNPTVHYAYLSGPSLRYLCPFFVQMILILAKHVVVIIQFLELQHVCLAQKFIAVIDYGLPIQTVCLIFSVGVINTSNDSSQNFLKQIECMTIIRRVGVTFSNISTDGFGGIHSMSFIELNMSTTPKLLCCGSSSVVILTHYL